MVLCGMVLLLAPANLAAETKTVVIEADKDTYVDPGNPTSNYGGKDWLIFGDYIWGLNEAYLHFNFSNRPSGWTKAVISIDCYAVSETFDVAVCLVEAEWDELSLDYTNKPAHGSVIKTITMATDDVYSIDVTDYISGDGISICLKAADATQEGYVQARSREDGDLDSSYFPPPKLTWTYQEADSGSTLSGDESEIPGFNPGLTGLILLGVGGIIAFSVKTKLRKDL